jgi:AmmeMemoRadiSam system protein B
MNVREPAVAGTFYPAAPTVLSRTVDELLAAAEPGPLPAAKAIVVPHAGYIYSGPVAATAYAHIANLSDTIERVVLLGPAHRAPLEGMAVVGADALRTPLGDIPVDPELRGRVIALPGVTVDDAAHAGEHSLEVHLPFLQRTLGGFTVLPIVVGRAATDDVARLLDSVWGGPETLIVVSTDLSHYEDHLSATAHDRATVEAILAGDHEAIGPYDACGAYPLRGLLVAAQRHGLQPLLLDRRTSGDTAGPPDRVVGYASLALASR